MINNKSIFISGSTGSFGSLFVNHIIKKYKPKRLIIFSRDELKQLKMREKISPEKYPFIRYFIGDIRDKERLDFALNGVDYVFHAAAMKQVDTSEYNPTECINTNIFGTQNLIAAAQKHKVKKFISISTDKAVNPINNRVSLQIIILATFDNIGPKPWLIPPSRAPRDRVIKLIAQIL